MTAIKRHLAAIVVAATLTVPAISLADDGMDSRPTFIEIATDAIVIRPVMLVTTVVGAALFVVTLPFSAPTGTMHEAADVLVVEPAKTFGYRCLGCAIPGYNRGKGHTE